MAQFSHTPLVFDTLVKTHIDGGACVSAASETKTRYKAAGRDTRKKYIEACIKLERLNIVGQQNGRQIYNFRYTYPSPNAPLPPMPVPSRSPSRPASGIGSPGNPSATPAARSPSVAGPSRPPFAAAQSPSPPSRGRSLQQTAAHRTPSQASQNSLISSATSSRASSVDSTVRQAVAADDRFLSERRRQRELRLALQREETPHF